MRCVLCECCPLEFSHSCNGPDKYEKWMGISDVKREWLYCPDCGLWHHARNYPLSQLERIYEEGYRNVDFRGENIKQAFDRIMAIKDSENDTRVKWLLKTAHTPKTLLDIGSGTGVFPYAMKEKGACVWCTEENIHSLGFINSLGIKCVKGIPYYAKFAMVSIVHVLEHIEDPVRFLKGLHKVIQANGKLFVEVPDAEAFNWLDPDHDDFNSCHTHSYDVSTLYGILKKAKYDVKDIHRVFYPERKLSRIMAICQRG